MNPAEIDFVSCGSQLKGFVHRAEAPIGTVVCLTGDGRTGSLSPTWPSVIALLLERGLDAAIFDFVSQGESSGDRTSLNLATGVSNFEDFLNCCENVGAIRTSKVGCLASSFGAAVLLNSTRASTFHRISLKSPALTLHEAYEREIGGIDNLKAWRQAKVHPNLGLSFEAYTSALSSIAYTRMLSLSVPILLTVGEMDEVVGLDSCRRAAVLGSGNIDLQIIPGGMHNYKQPGVRELFEKLNGAFFEAI